MKSLEELEEMLLDEIRSFRDRSDKNPIGTYYNELTGNMSSILTMMLSRYVYDEDDWDNSWLDDSLLTKIEETDNKYCVWGVLIKGRDNTTKQWTDPLYFEIKSETGYESYTEYTFLMGEEGTDEVTYKEFTNDRAMWDFNFYSNSLWNPSEREWKYIINNKKELKAM